MKNSRERVRFFSVNDGSIQGNLKKSELLISNFDPFKRFDINDIIEFYQVKLLFDNSPPLPSWSDEEYKSLKEKTVALWKVVREFWVSAGGRKLIGLLPSVELQYRDAFWELTDHLNHFKNIPASDFIAAIQDDANCVRLVLQHNRIVDHFAKEIRDILLKTPNAAEIILAKYEKKTLFHKSEYHLPKSLTTSDKEEIIKNYISSDDPNLNYIRLIVNAHALKLTDKTNYAAHILERKLNDAILNSSSAIQSELEIGIVEDQIEPVSIQAKGLKRIENYSLSYLKSTLKLDQIFRNLYSLFKLINGQGCIELVNKSSEVDPIEFTLIRANKEYLESWAFSWKNNWALLRLKMYQSFLKKNEISIEEALSFAVKEILVADNVDARFRISIPSQNSTFQEKIRSLAPEMEFLLKQYSGFIEDGEINLDLIRFSSSQINFGALHSGSKIKYAYGQGEEFSFLIGYFFGNRSMLYYIDPYKEKYDCLAALLLNEDVKHSVYESWQKRDIDVLISKGYLKLDENGYLRIRDEEFIFLVGKLRDEGVLSYWNYSSELREKILEMEQVGLLKYSSTLFTTDEASYLNYYLNKKEFTNGYDLRNKYSHGTNPESKGIQERDYLILLKLFCMIVFKIQDDLAATRKENSQR
jgi:hypothetical protein